jgi:hypothetical protein
MENQKNTVELTKTENILYNLTLQGDENVIGFVVVDHNQHIVIDDCVVVEALAYAYKRHPFLRSRLHLVPDGNAMLEIANPGQHSFASNQVEFERIKLNTIDELTRELEIFNMKTFDYKNDLLLWRFKMVDYDGNKLVFAFVLPFFLTDGLNISMICIEIVNLINSILKHVECKEMLTTLDPVDSMYGLLETHGLIDDKKIELISQNTDRVAHFKLDEKLRNLKDSGLKINILTLDKESSMRLVNHAKANKIKITGFLLAAMFYAFKKLYEENGLTLPNDLAASVSVNMRMRLSPNVDFSHMRNLIALADIRIQNRFTPDSYDVWNEANYINARLCEEMRIDNGSLFKVTHNFKRIDRILHVLRDQQQTTSDKLNEVDFDDKCDIALSNIGLYLQEKHAVPNGPLRIVEIYHGESVQSYPNFVPSFLMHSSTWNGRFMFELSTNRRAIGFTYANRFMQLFESILENC